MKLFGIGLLAVAIGFMAANLSSTGAEMVGDRVKAANDRAGSTVRKLVRDAGLAWPPKRLFIRAFKSEAELEVWAGDGDKPLSLVKTYPIAEMSGSLGPKRRKGDLQVPEGLYSIDRFNPQSKFHLSLGINYPNASDRKRSDAAKPGGDIFIHGDRKSIGCLAMTDEKIEEIYLLALAAKPYGKIPVHIFPFRMSPNNVASFNRRFPANRELWQELRPFFDAFDTTKIVPNFTVASRGEYMLIKHK
jgi:murein L,D-transpeptidase YafK